MPANGGAGFGKIYDIYFPPEFLCLFDGPSCNIMDMTDVSVLHDPENEECKIAYPDLLFDHNIVDGRGMMCSVLTLNIGNSLPEPALRPRHRRRPHDVLRADPEHR